MGELGEIKGNGGGVMRKIKEYEGMGKIKGHRRATQGREDKGGMVGGTGKIKGHDMRMGKVLAFEMSLEGWVQIFICVWAPLARERTEF